MASGAIVGCALLDSLDPTACHAARTATRASAPSTARWLAAAATAGAEGAQAHASASGAGTASGAITAAMEHRFISDALLDSLDRTACHAARMITGPIVPRTAPYLAAAATAGAEGAQAHASASGAGTASVVIRAAMECLVGSWRALTLQARAYCTAHILRCPSVRKVELWVKL